MLLNLLKILMLQLKCKLFQDRTFLKRYDKERERDGKISRMYTKFQ